jgi:hypothetical protein
MKSSGSGSSEKSVPNPSGKNLLLNLACLEQLLCSFCSFVRNSVKHTEYVIVLHYFIACGASCIFLPRKFKISSKKL